MEGLLVLMTMMIPIIMALCKIINVYVPEKFHPLVPLLIGVVLCPLGGSTFVTGMALNELLWAGLLSGMAAGGSYSPTDLIKKP